MDMLVQHILDDYIEDIKRMAHHHTRRLIRAGSLMQDEQEDFVQDLMIHIVKQWPQLAQTDFEPLGFAWLIIRQKSINELRRRNSHKARFHRGNCGQLPEEVADLSGLDESSVQQRVALVLSQLSPEDRTVVEAILSQSGAQAAEQLGLSPKQLASRRQQIGETLERLL